MRFCHNYTVLMFDGGFAGYYMMQDSENNHHFAAVYIKGQHYLGSYIWSDRII